MELEKLNGGEKEGLHNYHQKVHRTRDKKSITIIFLIFVITGLLIAIFVLLKLSATKCRQSVSRNETVKTKTGVNILLAPCKSNNVIINPSYVDESNVFRELTLAEMQTIEKYVYDNFEIDQSNLYNPIYDTIFIQNIELYLPNKEDVLEFLDNLGKQPERQARVTVVHYPFNVTYYIIGPVANPTYHKLAKFSDRENPLNEFATGMFKLNKVSNLEKFSKQIFIDMWPIMKDTYEEFEAYDTAEDLFNVGLIAIPFPETINRESEIYSRIFWMLNNDHRATHSVDFCHITVLANITSRNESKWDIIGVTYGLQNFKDIETLMNLYEKNKITITKIGKPSKPEKEKAELKKRGNQQNYFDSQEPMQVLPNGPRFSLEGQKVTYLDWKFNFLVQSSSGPALFDVQFKNQRIAYELSLQEASSFYSTGHSLFSSSNTLDSSFGGMGKAASLINGIDCPQQSIYQDVVVYFDGAIKHVKDAICIFEQNPSVPLRRHHHSTGKDSYTYGGMNDASLVIRFITDMFYYDYIHDFVFHQNGVVEIKTILTGVLLLNPYYAENKNKYGYEVIRNTMAAYHDHFMLFKVDLDILGTKNSFKTIDVVTDEFGDPWEAYPVTKKYLKQNKRTTESDAKIKYSFDEPKYYVMYNENELNKYGNVRGYRVLPVHKIKEVYPNDHKGTKATEWSKYQLSISKYKDTERYGSCMFNYFPQHDKPLCSFDQRLEDDDNIVNEDLIAWVPIGSMHIPSTEDYPTVTTTGNQVTLLIKPFNYFDEDPSMASANNVYIAKAKNKTVLETNNTPKAAACVIPGRNIY